jgi:hypothetical protein
VLASVASQSVLHLLLEEVSAPGADRLNWQKILRYFIRYPLTSEGWERHSLALFRDNKSNPPAIPKHADLPELAGLKSQRMPVEEAEKLWTEKRVKDLRQKYVDLEKQLSRYRYP